jgi:hypothetical protein
MKNVSHEFFVFGDTHARIVLHWMELFSSLPEDVWILIFRNINYRLTFRFSTVSKFFHEITFKSPTVLPIIISTNDKYNKEFLDDEKLKKFLMSLHWN